MSHSKKNKSVDELAPIVNLGTRIDKSLINRKETTRLIVQAKKDYETLK